MKKIYEKLKRDYENILFREDTLTNNLFKKLKKSKYIKDNEFLNLIVN